MFVLFFSQEGEAGEKGEEGEKTEGERREGKGERERKGEGKGEREGQSGGVGLIYWDHLNQKLEALFSQISVAAVCCNKLIWRLDCATRIITNIHITDNNLNLLMCMCAVLRRSQ